MKKIISALLLLTLLAVAALSLAACGNGAGGAETDDTPGKKMFLVIADGSSASDIVSVTTVPLDGMDGANLLDVLDAAQIGYTEDSYKQMIASQLEQQALRDKVAPVEEPTDDEVIAYANENLSTYNDARRSSHILIKVAEDAYGNVGSIVAIPDNSDDDKTLYSYYLNNYETLGLGEWLGAKYNVYAEDGTSEGGVFQTVAETLDLVNENDVNTLSVYAIFGIVPGRAYAVPGFEDGRFKFQIMNNFLRLDYSVIYDIIGSDYNAFAEANHIIGFKMSMWGQNYFYIDYALDLMDNAFSCDFNTDSEMSSVTSIVLYGPENTDEQLEIWKDYASSAETLQIGEFKEAYTSSFGMQVDTFESAADALEYVNTNGRPAGGFDPDVVMVFGNESVSLTITLKSLELKMEITPAE